MSQAVEIIVPIASMTMVFGIVYVAVTAWHRQKMAMIEAGMNPKEKIKSKHSRLRTALLFVLVPIGLFLGNYLGELNGDQNSDVTGLLFGFIFGGLALLLSYFIEPKKNDQKLID